MQTAFDFTVIVPSFNKRGFIRQALVSILSQEGCRIQLLIVDGGSTDGTAAIAAEILKSDIAYKRIQDGWEIRMTVERDLGQSHAINKGFMQARGRICCWLNADDFYYEGALQQVKRVFDEDSALGMLYGGLDFVDESGVKMKTRASRPWNRRQLLDSYCYIPQPATFWRTDLIPVVGLLDVGLYYCMDYDYWLRLSAKTKVGQVAPVLAAIRIMPGTKTGVSPLNAMPEALRVGRRHGARYFSKFRLAYWLWYMRLPGVVRWASRRVKWGQSSGYSSADSLGAATK